MTIRRANLADIGAVAPLFNAYRVFYEQTSDLDAAVDYLTANLANERSTLFVAEEGSCTLGFTQLYPAWCSVTMQPFVVLYDLYVDPSARERGIGSDLIRHAHAWAKDVGADRVELETAHTNVTAQSLYETLGYERDDEFRKYSFAMSTR